MREGATVHPILSKMLKRLALLVCLLMALFALAWVSRPEVSQWGILLDAEPGFLPPRNGGWFSRTNSFDRRCDSMNHLFWSRGDTAGLRWMLHRATPRYAPQRIEERSVGQPADARSGQWCFVRLPALTVRSRWAMPLGLAQGFPQGMAIFQEPQAALDSLRLGPVQNRSRGVWQSGLEDLLLDGDDRTLLVGKDTLGYVAFEGAIPSPARVEVRRYRKDSTCFVNHGNRPLHGFAAMSWEIQPAWSLYRSRLEPNQEVCLEGPGNWPEPRGYALEQGMSEVQARAFAKLWQAHLISEAFQPAVQWCAWLDPADLERALPLRVSWPWARKRRHVLLVHRDPILDSTGCPAGRGVPAFPHEVLEATERLANGSTPTTRWIPLDRLALGLDSLKFDPPIDSVEQSRIRRELGRNLVYLQQEIERDIRMHGTPSVTAIALGFSVDPKGMVSEVEVRCPVPAALGQRLQARALRIRFDSVAGKNNRRFCLFASIPSPRLRPGGLVESRDAFQLLGGGY